MGASRLRMSDDVYLAFDRCSEEKHELWDGEVYAMTGASLAHNLIVGNLVRHIGNELDGSKCRALPSDMRVRIPEQGYVYPDLTIVCGPLELQGETDILLNPRTVIEVLSPSTANFDRGDKFSGYSSMASVEEVVFVSQHARHVEHRTRQPDGSWVLRSYRGDDAVPLVSLPAPLSLSRIYQGVDL